MAKNPHTIGQCRAIVLHEWPVSWKRPAGRPQTERIRCKLGSTQKVKGKCFCRKHARLAREGFLDGKNRVAPQQVIKTIRAAQRAFWASSRAQLETDARKIDIRGQQLSPRLVVGA